jgi:putative ABC transport system permease protein
MDGWFGLVLRNAGRSPLRGAMTIAAVAVSLVAFILVHSVNDGWVAQVEQTPDNRVITRHRSGWRGKLPLRYVQTVRESAGVRRAMGASWAFFKLPEDRQVSFESIAVEAEPFVAMHYELEAPEPEKLAFVANRRGALVSLELAQEFSLKIGQVVHFRHPAVPGTVELAVEGIFQSRRAGFAQRAIYLHWEYLNELLPETDQNLINIIAAEVLDPSQGARIAAAIDIALDRGAGQTFTQEDQAVNAQLVGQFGAILAALNAVGYLILGIVLLVLSNTMAMVVRERTKEYGALRALGFLRKHLLGMVVAEASLLGLFGGILGLALAFPLVQQAASGYLQKEMSVAPLSVSLQSAVTALVIGALLGALAGAIPGYRLSSQRVVDALRRVA